MVYAALLRAAHQEHHKGHDDVTIWTVLSCLYGAASLACLIPAALASYRRQPQLAGLLAAAALVPCAQLRFVTPGLETSSWLPGVLSCASYVCSMLCIVQLVMLLIVHWNPYLKAPSQDRQKLTLALCALLLAGGWKCRLQFGSTRDFERFSSIWVQALIGGNLMVSWLCTGAENRRQATEVFLHARFWRRALCLAPLMTAFVILMSFTESSREPPQLIWAALRGLSAGSATFAIWSVLPKESSTADLGLPAAHWLVCGCAATLVPMSLFTFGGDYWEHQVWRWPTLSMAATSPIGDFVLTAYALPFAVATAIAIRIIDSVPPEVAVVDLKRATFQSCHKAGCQFARFGVVFFIVSCVWAETDKVGRIFHTGFSMAMFSSFWASILLTALGSDLASRNGKARVIIATCIVSGMGVLLTLFLVANNYVFPKWKVPHYLSVAYACSEYTLLALIAAYPMTWLPEAAAWQQRGYTDALPRPVASTQEKPKVDTPLLSGNK